MKNQKYSNLEIVGNSENSDDDVPPVNTSNLGNKPVNACTSMSLILILLMILINFVLFFIAPKKTSSTNITQTSTPGFKAKNIAFGSCSSYDLRQMHIWTDAIIPSKPDVWIWAGDMVYLDDNEINCAIFEPSKEWQQSCNCSSTWLLNPPYTCHAGDAAYANERWLAALNNEQYNAFLDYMCPNARALGMFPPPGTDSSVCERGIYGIYDDHDFGANDGNRREPDKRVFKEMYLDAVGEARDSPRRGPDRGAWGMYTLNEGVAGQEVDVFLLDERYERETLPCDTRRDYCQYVVLPDNSGKYAHKKAWCTDFIASGLDGHGSCCSKDETIFYEWCSRPDSPAHKFYRYACDVTFEHFGQKSLVINSSNELAEPDGSEIRDRYQDSPFCELLGKAQRRWLRRAIAESTAPVKLFVSGSVLVYNPLPYTCGKYHNYTSGLSEPVPCRCGGDNVDCYSVAQKELLHLISSASGCAVVLTGDYHFSDIKALRPGSQVYSEETVYGSLNNSQTVYQIMSSGMSTSTGRNVSCEDYRLDPLGLRTHPECAFVRGPNFGRVVLETSPSTHVIERLRLQVLSGLEADKVLLETVVQTNTCNPVAVKP